MVKPPGLNKCFFLGKERSRLKTLHIVTYSRTLNAQHITASLLLICEGLMIDLEDMGIVPRYYLGLRCARKSIMAPVLQAIVLVVCSNEVSSTPFALPFLMPFGA